MDIAKGIKIVGTCLFLKSSRTLIISDLHIGQEEAMNKEGILIPRFQFKELLEETKSTIEKTKLKTVILNGDIKHNFGRISVEEWRNVIKFIENMPEGIEVKLIEGNHDRVLRAIAAKKNIQLKDHELINDTYICHGHEIPKGDEFKEAKTVIIGHEHPAITLRERARMEKYKCFLKGAYKGKTLIVMPSSNNLNEGTDILQENLLSPFLKKAKLSDFDVYILSDSAYHFGKLKNLEKLGK